MAARKHQDKFTTLVDIIRAGSQLPCFNNSSSSVQSMKNRWETGVVKFPKMSFIHLKILKISFSEISIKIDKTLLYTGV